MFNSESVLSVPTSELTDIHLAFLYNADFTWGNITTTRANRFYLNHDIDNSNFTALDEFHEKIEEFKPDVVVASGF